MKAIKLSLLLLTLSAAGFAQVHTDANGNVGIGTTSPLQKFVVSDEGADGFEIYLKQPVGIVGLQAYNRINSNHVKMQFDASQFSFTIGNMGIGTTSPVSKLDVNGSINMTDGQNLTWGGSYGPGIPTIASSASAGINFYPTGSTSGSAMKVDLNGNVLINKLTQTSTAYKLDINGKVRANEIVVNTTGADFVFENDYRLRPIAELEQFVKQNKHLPEIPTAKTMQNDGVGVSELQTKLLQKVEELTLYIIQQQKEIDELKKKLNK